MVASEMTPLAKTGGLADVVAALSAQLRGRGHDVRVVLPFYGDLRRQLTAYGSALPALRVAGPEGEEGCAVAVVQGGGGVPVFLIEHEGYYARPGLYHDAAMRDFPDNPRRFGFLCRAAVAFCLATHWHPDIVHVHDWPTAVMAYWLATGRHPWPHRPASVLTLHNLAYQGVYHPGHAGYLGIGADGWHPGGFESLGALNLLKGGIAFADGLNTVSPTFAREVTAPGGGFGLEGLLRARGEDFVGILNGLDTVEWDPARDRHLAAPFDAKDRAGKARCKAALQEAMGLEQRPGVPLVAAVGRLTEQKGFHLLHGALAGMLGRRDLQFVLLGAGDARLAEAFRGLAAAWPGRVAVHVGFSEPLAHQIEAGADFFAMPSLFEPCGLNQMYSLRYGTLPIVRATGGLEDTVVDAAERGGTGFKFREATVEALAEAMERALDLWERRPATIRAMIGRAMKADFGWGRSVEAYEKLYERALRRAGVG